MIQVRKQILLLLLLLKIIITSTARGSEMAIANCYRSMWLLDSMLIFSLFIFLRIPHQIVFLSTIQYHDQLFLLFFPVLSFYFIFRFWEIQTESQHADFVASGKCCNRYSICRSCYFWKMWQKLKYADVTTSGKCNRNLVCRSCYVWWKMQRNSSVCMFLLRLGMAMNS